MIFNFVFVLECINSLARNGIKSVFDTEHDLILLK